MRWTNQFSLIPIFEKLLNNAPFVVGGGADEHAAAFSSMLIQISLFVFLCLREPALAHASFCNVAIDPETKLDGTASALNIDRIWSDFERFLPNPINAIFEKLAYLVIVANKVKVTFQVSYIVGINMLMENHILFTVA